MYILVKFYMYCLIVKKAKVYRPRLLQKKRKTGSAYVQDFMASTMSTFPFCFNDIFFVTLEVHFTSLVVTVMFKWLIRGE